MTKVTISLAAEPGAAEIDVILDGPALGVGLDLLLQGENSRYGILGAQTCRGERFGLSQLLKPSLKRKSLCRRLGFQGCGLLVRQVNVDGGHSFCFQGKGYAHICHGDAGFRMP